MEITGWRTASRRNGRTVRRARSQQTSLPTVLNGARAPPTKQSNDPIRDLFTEQAQTGGAKVLQFVGAQKVPSAPAGTAGSLRWSVRLERTEIRKSCHLNASVCLDTLRKMRIKWMFYTSEGEWG